MLEDMTREMFTNVMQVNALPKSVGVSKCDFEVFTYPSQSFPCYQARVFCDETNE